MGKLKDVIYLSNEDYETLVSTGTVTIDGETLIYDENNVYITPDESSGGGNGGGMQVLKFVQSDPFTSYNNVSLPFAVGLFDTSDNLVATEIINYEYGGTSTFSDPDTGTNYQVNFNNIIYDETNRQLVADIVIGEQS